MAWFINPLSGSGQDGFIAGEPRLAYWTVGHKSPTVIVIHGGFGVTHQYLRPEFDQLSQVAKVIYYDQRGIGESEPATSYTWQMQVDDLDRLIKHFSFGQVFLAASSWGTTLAMLYTYRHPNKIKGLLLSGTYQWEGRGMNLAQRQVYKQRMDSLTNTHLPMPSTESPVRAIKSKIYEQRQLVDSAEISWRGYPTVTVEKEIIKKGRSNSAELRYSLATAPVFDSLARVAVPILIFNGSRKNCPIDWAHRYVKIFPHAELFTIDAACHDPWLSDPKKFSAKSIEFMKKVTKARN